MLGVVVVCAACMVYYHLVLFVPTAQRNRAEHGYGEGYSFGADFYPIWFTARESLLHHCDPYNPEMTRRIQIGLFGRPLEVRNPKSPPDSRAFANPLFAELVFWPFALLPFSEARILFALLLPLVTALSVFLWLRALHLTPDRVELATILLLTLSSYTGLEGLFAEQIGLVVGFLLAAALAALVRKRLFFSGSLLALTLIKPQMMLLIAAYLLLWSCAQWRVRWQFTGGFFLTALLLNAASLLIWPHWIQEWFGVVFAYRRYATPPLLSYLFGNPIGTILFVALTASAIMLSWRMRHVSPESEEFGLTISLLLGVTAIAVLPGHAAYDHLILLPGVLVIAFSWRLLTANLPCRIVLTLTTLAVCWQWISAPLVIAAHPFLSHPLFASAVLTLPIRTAASIPFGVCALLGLLMWQRHESNPCSRVNNDATLSCSAPQDPLQTCTILRGQIAQCSAR